MSHLQFDALLSASRTSASINDFALVALLGLLGPNPRNLRDVRIAARHADPRTRMRYDRARKNLDRHPNYIVAAHMASGT
ncbi:MAG: hypothetical protein WCF12_12050 [Propionicimonas sp.]